MKKMIAMISALALSLSLAGCGLFDGLDLPPFPTVTPQPTPSPSATAAPSPTPSPAPQKADNISLSINRHVQQAMDPQNGTQLILSFSYDSPRVYIDGMDAVTTIINEQLAISDEEFYSGNDYGQDGSVYGYNDMLTAAEDNYLFLTENQIEGQYELSATRSVNAKRIDDRLLSVTMEDYYYTGGAHGMTVLSGMNFDTRTGQLLSLEDLSPDYEALSAFLTETMLSQVQADPELAARMDVVQPQEYEAALAALLRQRSWYFDDRGLNIFSDVYELGSYAAGMLELNIPYEQLKGHIDDSFLPQPLNGEGTVQVMTEEEIGQTATNVIDKLSVSEEGQQLFILGNGTVRDVQVVSGNWSDRFYPTGLLWAGSDLENKALQIQCVLSQGMPQLKISYTDMLGSHELYLSQDAEGRAALVPADQVAAVG